MLIIVEFMEENLLDNFNKKDHKLLVKDNQNQNQIKKTLLI